MFLNSRNVFMVLALSFGASASVAQDSAGVAVYAEHCAVCHELNRFQYLKPHAEARSAETVLSVIERGVMWWHAKDLSPQERQAVAEYLSGDRYSGVASTEAVAPMCSAERMAFDFRDRSGGDLGNTRFVPDTIAGLAVEDVPNLALKWAVAFPHTDHMRSQPTIAGGAVFLPTQNGTVYAFDQQTGCLRWSYQAEGLIRSNAVISPWSGASTPPNAPVRLFFADIKGMVYALNAATGKELWRVPVDDSPHNWVSGSPILQGDRLFVPVSAREEAWAIDPTYECCTHRGSVLALNAATGARLWQTYTLPETRQVGTTDYGTAIVGPSGAGVWSTPTIDVEGNRLYIGTGEQSSGPAEQTSDAIIALDMDSGEIQWVYQAHANDIHNPACDVDHDHPNCPPEDGPNNDFGAPSLLLDLDNGSRILVAPQKGGVLHGLDPYTGRVRWKNTDTSKRIGFGTAAEGTTILVGERSRTEPAGLRAIDASNGETLWSVSAEGSTCGERRGCAPGVQAPPTVISGVAFAGALDGYLRAYDSRSGKVLWEFDTTRVVPTRGVEPGRGGTISGLAGPAIANGSVFAVAGYGSALGMGLPGNVLLAFSAD